MGFLWFFLGMMTGGCLGVMIMCLFQINRRNYYEQQIHKIEEQIKKK